MKQTETSQQSTALLEAGTEAASHCPNCGGLGGEAFYEVRRVPAHSVLLMSSRGEALTYPRGDIRLGFCPSCGFIWNMAFDPRLHEYSAKYEETQGFSPTFNTFHRQLAERLVRKYDLHDKDVVEIGCGKGEFLTLLCELGQNRGTGFDPAYIDARNTSPAKDRIRFVKDFYSAKYTDLNADFLCCKMTLEHIPDTEAFVGTVRESLGDRTDTVVFFQVPNADYVLQDLAFWDVYYEHCSYFTAGSLIGLFRRQGFDVLDHGTDYDGQYLMIEARPSASAGEDQARVPEEELADTAAAVASFKRGVPDRIAAWQRRLRDLKRAGKRVVLWGAGSKGVSFLTSVGICDEVGYAVDINPYKIGTYMAGTGHEIVPPDFLSEYQPDEVIVMNPVYLDEIGRILNAMGLYPDLIPVDAEFPCRASDEQHGDKGEGTGRDR